MALFPDSVPLSQPFRITLPHFELGLALQQQGKKDEARQEFQRANYLDAHFLAPTDKY